MYGINREYKNMVSSYVNDGVNIYKPLKVNNQLELPLCSAFLNGPVECANKILEIYELDLQFIASCLKCDSKFWLINTIFIGYGDNECKTIVDLYEEYRRLEPEQCIDNEKCVVILLKRDNLTPVNVICLSPKSKQGQLIAIRMVKCIYLNDVLDINAKNGNGISLLSATATSGMFNATIRLLHLGTETDVLELASFSMLYGQLEYLDNVYTKFGFKMYDIFTSNKYFPRIFGKDNWPIFEYVVHAIMLEKHLSWPQIVNYIRIIYDSDNDHNTVFHHAFENQHYKIATKILQYSDCQTQTSQCTCLPIKSARFRAETLDILVKLLEIDPTQFEVIEDNEDEEGYAVGVFHRLLTFSSFEQVKQIYEKYSSVKDLFFKSRKVGLKYITRMLSMEQYDKVKYVIQNCSEIPREILHELLLRITGSHTNGDIVELFQFVMSMKGINFMHLPTEVKNKLFGNALVYAKYRIFQILLMECDLNQIDVWHSGDLLTTVLQGNATSNNIFNKLLQKQINFKGIHILHRSVQANNFFTTKKLLELGMDINEYDKKGYLPIHYAKSVEIFELLITWSSKSFVNFKTKCRKYSPLHCCMVMPAGEAINRLIRYILANGGDLNAKDIEMRTPLFMISDTARGKLLFERTPDITVIGKNGNSMITDLINRRFWYNYPIKSKKYENLLQILKSQHQQIGKYLLLAIARSYQLSNELLEQPDVDVTICDVNKNSLLHLAIQTGNLNIIEKLIEKGVPLENRNKYQDTPLLLMCGHLNWVRLSHLMLLLKYNPDVNVRNKSNWSPILLAARQYTEKFDIVLELLVRGANILDSPQPNGQRAYDYLTERSQKILKFLV